MNDRAEIASSAQVVAGPVVEPTGANWISEHEGEFRSGRVRYTARVETFRVGGVAQDPAADLVVTSYLAKDVASSDRPVLFIFNGGPIVCSALFHLGGFGPKRLDVSADLSASPTDFPLIDNPDCVLDVADLVFFDPAGTGLSRVVEGSNPQDYFSVEADARQTTEFIVSWASRHGRMASPKVLVGTSYGSVRAAVVARQMSELAEPLPVAGAILLGQALNIAEIAQRPANILSYVVSLPTLAALGWYHERVERKGRSFEQFLDEVRAFAGRDYLIGLYQGNALDVEEERRLAITLAGFTGLSAEAFMVQHLRVTKDLYRTELLKGQGQKLSDYDARYVSPMTSADNSTDDAWMCEPAARVISAITSAYENYLSDFLNVRSEQDYRFQVSLANGLDSWGWGSTSPFGDWPYMASIATAMAAFPTMRVLVGTGYHDPVTTVGVAEYATTQSGWPKDRVHLARYDGGHMFYFYADSCHQLMNDVRGLLASEVSDDHSNVDE